MAIGDDEITLKDESGFLHDCVQLTHLGLLHESATIFFVGHFVTATKPFTLTNVTNTY